MTVGRSIWDSDALRQAPRDSPLVACRDSKRMSKFERDGFGKIVRKDPVTPLFVAHPEHYCPEAHCCYYPLQQVLCPSFWNSGGSCQQAPRHPDSEWPLHICLQGTL